jgi:hypothetical protein
LNALVVEVQPAELLSDYANFRQARDEDGSVISQVGKLASVELSMLTDLVMPAGTVIAIEFPIYNPEAPRTLRHSYMSDGVDCSAVQNAGEELSCFVMRPQGSDNETLIIRDVITEPLEKGTEIKLRIDKLYNPLSMATIQLKAMFANESPRDGNLYPIELGTVSFRARRPATISEVTIECETLVV